jgi:hypothetical protein
MDKNKKIAAKDVKDVTKKFVDDGKLVALAAEFEKKIAAKDADQYMLRLPPGLRDRVARRAAENGRSMNTEIVEAIEEHLTRADRVTQLWELFRKHQENIEAIPWLVSAVGQIESYLDRAGDSDTPMVLHKWSGQKRHDAYVANLPLVTAEQVKTIKALLKEIGRDEKHFLDAMGVSRIEDVRDFAQVMGILKSARRYRAPVTAEQVQTNQGAPQKTESDEKEAQ